MRRALAAAAGLAVIVAIGAAAGTTGALGTLGGATTGTGLTPDASTAGDVATAAVVRRTMQTAAELSGTLGYEGSRSVFAGLAGTVTRLPEPGTLITRGEVLYELDGRIRPRLLHGSRPMWRPMGPGMSDGADVLQLERNLQVLGYAPKGMKVDRHWSAKTTTAVKRWQKAIGRTRDGTLDGGDLVFMPGSIRVATLEVAPGASVGPGSPVLGATTAKRVVTLDISAGRQSLVEPGQAVALELPGGTTVPGTVRSIGRVATAAENGGSSTVPVTIDIESGAELPALDAAPVTVYTVTTEHPDVLAVPVNSLVALLEGGYAVEVVDADGSRRYTGVETGLFEDGLVEVSGDGLAEGDDVVVPE